MKLLYLMLMPPLLALARPSLAEERPVVMLKGNCKVVSALLTGSGTRFLYTVTLKNIGTADVKNIRFWFDTPNSSVPAEGESIAYLPAKDTIEAQVWHGYHVKDFPYNCDLPLRFTYEEVE